MATAVIFSIKAVIPKQKHKRDKRGFLNLFKAEPQDTGIHKRDW
jgi:hypothetical protein